MNLENVLYIVKDITSKSLCKFDFQTVIEGTLATTLLFDGLYKLGFVLCGQHPLGPDQESIFNIPKPVIQRDNCQTKNHNYNVENLLTKTMIYATNCHNMQVMIEATHCSCVSMGWTKIYLEFYKEMA